MEEKLFCRLTHKRAARPRTARRSRCGYCVADIEHQWSAVQIVPRLRFACAHIRECGFRVGAGLAVAFGIRVGESRGVNTKSGHGTLVSGGAERRGSGTPWGGWWG